MGDLIVHIERDAELRDDVLRLLERDIRRLVVFLRELFHTLLDELEAAVVEHQRQRLGRCRHHLLLLICLRSAVYHYRVPPCIIVR